MYPLDFEEHLWAQGKAPLAEIIKQSFMGRIPLDDALDKEAKFLFKEYMIVGGMPQSVLTYLSSVHSFDKADQAKKLILSLSETVNRNQISKRHIVLFCQGARTASSGGNLKIFGFPPKARICKDLLK